MASRTCRGSRTSHPILIASRSSGTRKGPRRTQTTTASTETQGVARAIAHPPSEFDACIAKIHALFTLISVSV